MRVHVITPHIQNPPENNQNKGGVESPELTFKKKRNRKSHKEIKKMKKYLQPAAGSRRPWIEMKTHLVCVGQ